MKILIASDHAGFERKEELKNRFPNITWSDFGPSDTTSVDYPDYAKSVALEIQKIEFLNKNNNIIDSLDGPALGVLICGSGQGMAITANKFSSVRAALCDSSEITALAREHNNANILCVGSRFLNADQTCAIFNTFISTRFAGGRHNLRVNKIG